MTGPEIRAWREQRHMSAQSLAAALGVSRRTIVAYESGQTPVPMMAVLALWAIDRNAKIENA